jgi:hypothetical protein
MYSAAKTNVVQKLLWLLFQVINIYTFKFKVIYVHLNIAHNELLIKIEFKPDK